MNCDILFDRTPLPRLLTRILPAPDPEYSPASGLTLVWQEAESIFLRRVGKDCHDLGTPVELVRSKEFWSVPDDNGLADVAGLAIGRTAVTWTLDNDVWVRVVTNSDGRPSELGGAIKVSGAGKHVRSDVRIARGPKADDGFIVAWSSWKQDGDGWGVFARRLDKDGNPLGGEVQLNSATAHFQWKAELSWCPDTKHASVWGLWTNTTESGEHQGPILRHFSIPSGTNATLQPSSVEVDLGGSPIPASKAVQCTHDGAMAVWLQKTYGELCWREVSEAGQVTGKTACHGLLPGRHRGSSGGGRDPHNVPAFSTLESLSRFSRFSELHDLADKWLGDLGKRWPSLSAISNEVPPMQAEATLGGDVSLALDDQVVAVLTRDASGGLDVQVSYTQSWSNHSGMVTYPKKPLVSGVSAPRMAWDHSYGPGSPHLVVCFNVGDEFSHESPKYGCVRRSLPWMMVGQTSIWETFLWIVAAIMASTIYVVPVICCLRFTLLRRPGGRRRQVRGRRRRRSRSRDREGRDGEEEGGREEQVELGLTQQLDRIPSGSGSPTGESPTGEAMAPGVSFDCIRDPSESAECPICQTEVEVRVALRPCGHTACRDCVTRLVETSSRCHMCRARFTGFQPVFL